MKIKPEYIIGFFIIITLAFFSYNHVIPFIVAGCGILAAIFFILLISSEDFNFLFSLFFISFFVRLVIATFIYEYRLFNGEWEFFGDGHAYVYNGNAIADMWAMGLRDFDYVSSYILKVSGSGTLGSYDFWNAFVLFFSERNAISLVYINSLASSLAVIFVYYMADQLYDKRAARIAALLTAFWPSMFIWSIQNFKEPITIFLIVALFWAVLKIKAGFKFHLLVIIILLSMALKEFRGIAFFIFYAVVLPISLIVPLFNKHRAMFIFLAIIAVAAIILYINYVRHDLVGLITFSPGKTEDFSLLRWIYERRSERAYGNTALLTNFNTSNPFSLVFFIPMALLIGCFGPFPWQSASFTQIAAIPEMLIYYLLMPAVFLGIKYLFKNKTGESGIIIIFVVVMMMVLAIIEGNLGTLFRHRAMVLPFLFILAAIGISSNINSKKVRKSAI
jgi:4-amino-4-deoxy-L-arabinose transferase-like glycosyltransferase